MRRTKRQIQLDRWDAERAAREAEAKARAEQYDRDYPIAPELVPLADRFFAARQDRDGRAELRARAELLAAAWSRGTRGVRIPLSENAWYLTVSAAGF